MSTVDVLLVLLGMLGAVAVTLAAVGVPLLLHLRRTERERVAANQAGESACHAFQREMHAKSIVAFETLARVIDTSTRALTLNTEMLRRIEARLERLPPEQGDPR